MIFNLTDVEDSVLTVLLIWLDVKMEFDTDDPKLCSLLRFDEFYRYTVVGDKIPCV